MNNGSAEANQGYEPPVEEEKLSSLSGAFVYPVKSFAGTEIADGWQVGSRGFVFDRNWMTCTPDGQFLTQREIPPFSLIKPTLNEGELALSAPGMPDISVGIHDHGEEMTARVWKSEGISVRDQGDEVAEWLQSFVNSHANSLPGSIQKNVPELRFVAMDPEYVRQVSQTHSLRETDQVGLADGYPFLLISQGSLDGLNERLGEKGKPPLLMNRFRPNLVSSDLTPNVEDRWKVIRIGEIEFDVVKPCARCNVTRVEQAEGVIAGVEPLATLSDYRRANQLRINDTNDVMFGQNLIHRNQGVLNLNDPVKVLEYK